jgi:adenosylcobinamide-GDP ribazoletransferase
MTALTGGLHEDGLADMADGFGGGRSRERKLAIMRDSRLGTYGALALIFAVALKATALAAILADPVRAAAALLGVGTLSRSFAVWHWHATPPAGTTGWRLQQAGRTRVRLRSVRALGSSQASHWLGLFGWAATFAILLALAATAFFSRFCKRQIGGHTGDTIGAAQQIAETLLLVGLSSLWAPIRP